MSFAFHTTVVDMEMNDAFALGAAGTRGSRVFPETAHNAIPQHNWIAAHRGDAELVGSAEIGLNTMLISEGIYLSQKLGREVTAAEVLDNSVSTALDV